jgi:hypothetical protein
MVLSTALLSLFNYKEQVSKQAGLWDLIPVIRGEPIWSWPCHMVSVPLISRPHDHLPLMESPVKSQVLQRKTKTKVVAKTE